MGGQSFKCPYCEKQWFLSKSALKDHLLGKHGMRNVEITGVANHTQVREKGDERSVAKGK